MSTATYPVRVDASLDDRLNRWLWLVKWVLVIPHLLVLAVLWMAFALLSVLAFFAILFTGHYPRAIFDFNVGVLRWTWRVQFYAYGALGTDRYPPFTLDDVPDYPAHLEVSYPQHLSRGLVLVRWWLLAIPHYIVIGFFIGGGAWVANQAGDRVWTWGAGLVGLLVLIAAIVLLFTGRYPRSVFDLVLGMNRWVLRVAAYAGLMVDDYPPFRLDMGGDDPGTTMLGRGSPPPAGPAGAPPAQPPAQPPARPPEPAARWSAGRVVTATIGVIVTLLSMAGIAAGGTMMWLDRAERDAAGFITSDSRTFRTSGYALASETMSVHIEGDVGTPDRLLGDARVRVEASDGVTAIFVGVARSEDVRSYLGGVRYTSVTSIGPNGVRYTDHAGTTPARPPAELPIWAAQSDGTGTQSIRWAVENGDWTVVVMRADGTAGVAVRADIAATVPALDWLSVTVLVTSIVLFVLGVVAVVLAVTRSTVSAQPRPDPRSGAAPLG